MGGLRGWGVSELSVGSGRPGGGYRAIADDLRQRIRGGAFPDGRLPAEATLVVEYGVARDTVRRAVAVLAAEGAVRSTHGRGHFICGPGSEDVGRPRYAVVAGVIQERIRGGAFAWDTALPSEACLQEEFEISRTTARKAYAVLEAEGLIERRAGARFVVAQPR